MNPISHSKAHKPGDESAIEIDASYNNLLKKKNSNQHDFSISLANLGDESFDNNNLNIEPQGTATQAVLKP